MNASNPADMISPAWPPSHVWVTGASSGIGYALASRFARLGVLVSITARSSSKLERLSKRHPNVLVIPADVSDPAALRQAAETAEEQNGPVELAIFCAAIWRKSENEAAAFDLDFSRNAMNTNFHGVANGLAAVLPEMKIRQSGHLAIVASVAGYVGLPGSAYYGPSKAALVNLAETLKPELNRSGIKIQIINPGFVRTPMTEINTFPMPFIMEVEDAVGRIMTGLQSSKFEISFPRRLVFLLKALRWLPYPLFFAVTSRLLRASKNA